MLERVGILDGLNRLDGDSVLGSAHLDICDQFFPNGLADPLGIKLLEL